MNTFATPELVAITGNTYPVKEQLKALGARWNPDLKAWMVTADKAEQAKALVSGSPATQSRSSGFTCSSSFRRTTCRVCGHKATGRYGDVIYRSGECRDCFEERKMGY